MEHRSRRAEAHSVTRYLTQTWFILPYPTPLSPAQDSRDRNTYILVVISHDRSINDAIKWEMMTFTAELVWQTNQLYSSVLIASREQKSNASDDFRNVRFPIYWNAIDSPRSVDDKAQKIPSSVGLDAPINSDEVVHGVSTCIYS